MESSGRRTDRAKLRERRSLIVGGKVKTTNCRRDRDNQAVLIDVVQAVEGPEVGPLPSLVWFERADCVNRVLPHALYFSQKSGFEFFGAFGNKKARLIPVTLGPPSADQIELLGQMVEGASQVVENVPGDGRKGDRNRFAAPFDR